MIELTVTIKGTTENGDGSTYKQKFLLHEPCQLSTDDLAIKQCVQQATNNSKILPDDIKVRALLVVQ